MNKDLENWFFPHADKLSKQLGHEKWRGRVPILVEDAWDFQQLKIEQLEKENAMMRELVEMVENNSKMPHQHKDYYERLCCLSERAREVLAKLTKGGI